MKLTSVLLFCFLHSQLVFAKDFAVASAHPLATEAGIEVLENGGNAFDAAVAVSAVLAVVEPYGSGIGGGGFYLLYQADLQQSIFIDAREKAPSKATRDMYLDTQGQVNPRASLNGALAAGIPGIPAALDHLSQKYGKQPLSRNLASAIHIAEKGFEADDKLIRLLKFRSAVFQGDSEAIFLPGGKLPQLGQRIKQPQLAETLNSLATEGRKGFYQGKVATSLVKGVVENGGIWTLDDLLNYQIIERKPIESTYRGMKITSAPPPSSGGIVLATALNILEQFDLSKHDQSTELHLVIESMRRAYRDRAVYLGDEDFVDIPKHKLLSKSYAQQLAKSIRLNRASIDFPVIDLDSTEGEDTTHFSIIDQEGNRVAATLSINYPFGSGFTPENTGVMLNNEMDDFSVKPGSPNVYGLVGGKANQIESNKRMLSSMTPSFLEHNDRIAVLGTPGGSRIISMVLLASLEFHKGESARSMVSLGRYHHQYLPNVIQYEPKALSPKTLMQPQRNGTPK